MRLSSSQLTDVSFAGSKIVIDGVSIENFMDDTNPIDFPDIDVTRIEYSANGKILRTAKPNAIIFSVTVIPGSAEDRNLYKKWVQYRAQPSGNVGVWNHDMTATIQCGNINMELTSYIFKNGTFLSGPGGPSSTGEGKMQGRTYTFAFEKAEM